MATHGDNETLRDVSNKPITKRKRTRIPANNNTVCEDNSKSSDVAIDDDETQLTQNDKDDRGQKRVKLSPQSSEVEQHAPIRSKYFSSAPQSSFSQLTDSVEAKSLSIQSEMSTPAASQTVFNECFVCKQSFATFTVDQRETHINHCLDQQATEDYMRRNKISPSKFIKTDAVTCTICNKDLTFYSERRRSQHIERCCTIKEEEAKPKKSTLIIKSNKPKRTAKKKEFSPQQDEETQQAMNTTASDDSTCLYTCFVCKKNITGLGVRARIKHLKLCAKLHNINQVDVKKMLELQKEQHKANADKEKQLNKKRKRKADEDEDLEQSKGRPAPKKQLKKTVLDDDDDELSKDSDVIDSNNPFGMFRFDKPAVAMSGSTNTADALEQVYSVAEWLTFLGMHQYIDLFVQNGFDTLDVCTELEQDDISFVSKAGHRKRILIAAKQLKQMIILRGKREIRRHNHELEAQKRQKEQQRREVIRSKAILHTEENDDTEVAPLLQTEFRKSPEEIAKQLRTEINSKDVEKSPVAKKIAPESESESEDETEDEDEKCATQPMQKSKFAPSTPLRTSNKPVSLLHLAKLSTPPRMSQITNPTQLKREPTPEPIENKPEEDLVISSLEEEEAKIVAMINNDWMSQKESKEKQMDVSVVSVNTDTTPIKLQLNMSDFISDTPAAATTTEEQAPIQPNNDSLLDVDIFTGILSQPVQSKERKSEESQYDDDGRSQSPDLFEDHSSDSDEEDEMMVRRRKSKDTPQDDLLLQLDDNMADIEGETKPIEPVSIPVDEPPTSSLDFCEEAKRQEENNHDNVCDVSNEDDNNNKVEEVKDCGEDADTIQDRYMNGCTQHVTDFCDKVKAMYDELKLNLITMTEKRDQDVSNCVGSSQPCLPDFELEKLCDLFTVKKAHVITTENWTDYIDMPYSSSQQNDHAESDYEGAIEYYNYSTQITESRTRPYSDSESEKGNSAPTVLFTQEDSSTKRKDTESRTASSQEVVEIITDDEMPETISRSKSPEKIKNNEKTKAAKKKKTDKPKSKKGKKESLPKVPLTLITTNHDDDTSFYHTQEKQDLESENDERDLSDSDSETRIINWGKKNELREKLVNNVMGANSTQSQNTRKGLQLRKKKPEKDESSSGSDQEAAKTRKKRKNPSSSQKSNAENVPDFDAMSIQQLKTLLSQYGVKAGTKSFMVEKLKQIHAAIQQR
jgi:hypothetical protein